VWLPTEAKPGLAMTRSMGDHIARNIGVVATPEVSSFEVEAQARLIIGSDGLFEFLENEEVAELAWRENKSAGEVAKELVELATKNWKQIQNYLDDIT
jgi:serine/threonine protein phosphatase PrpC